MTNRSVIYEMVIDLTRREWGVACPTDQTLTGPMQYGWDRFQKDPESMTLGGGLLAGSPLPGTRRMIFCGYSPQWEDFYVSALGGAMYIFHRIGVNYIWLRGQCTEDVVVVINLKGGEYTVRFEPINPEGIWEGYTDREGQSWKGFYALQKAIIEKYGKEYSEDWFRVLTVGPGARLTNFAGIGSSPIKDGKPTVVDDWAGRGGLGSRLLQHHHIAGIIFGGDWQDPAFKEAKELDEYFLEHFGQRAILSDLALSEKYRYVPKFETGGTFGVNMHTIGDRLFSFNYTSIYASDEDRMMQQENFIRDHYLRQFNDEIIKPRSFAHCGEPCAIACKKISDVYKKDYEPYATLGPNIGVFDHRAAEKLNKYVDTLGLDSIQIGGMVSWLMELLCKGIVNPSLFNLPEELPKMTFVSRPEEFDIVQDSAKNSEYAQAIIHMMLYTPQGEPFRLGLRYAAHHLDEEFGITSTHLAVYTAHGKYGCMVPNQYWTPGMFAPMPLMGKYFSAYGNEFIAPYQLGRKNVERFVYELYSENSGSCRFHRKWVEDIIDEIILSHFDLDFDYWQTNFRLAKSIHDYQSKRGVFWESERVVDIIMEFVLKWRREGLDTAEIRDWSERFERDKWKAAHDFWQDMYQGMVDAFAEGMEEPVHEEHGKISR